MPTIQVRKLDANWQPMRGNGISEFLFDRDAVGQIIATTILLLKGEWFENLNIGTPMFQQLLDHPTTTQAVGLILRRRILSVPYVTGISSFSVTYAHGTRAMQFIASVSTQFGAVTVSNIPQV